MDPREFLDDPVSAFMSSSFAQVAATDSVTRAARIMKNAGDTEAIVMDDSALVGIVTERDILYRVVAAGTTPDLVKVGEVMSSPVETIEESSKVGEAIAKMSKLSIRRLVVTRKGTIVGIVTQKAMVTGNVGQNFPLPELVAPTGFACPYCNASASSKEELSKHIDYAHAGGLGLLQGNVTKW
jgi:signal-transduction protein with cAMP-binding, CBS, and nucleotidyltransferase domain